MKQHINTLKTLAATHFKEEVQSVELLPVSGSDRRYFRLHLARQTVIGTYNANIPENNSYFYFTKVFIKHNIRVPEIFAVSKDHLYYLQQDLGSTSLLDKLLTEGLTDEIKQYYKDSLEQLACLQWVAGREVDFDQCFATRFFDETTIKGDLLYFKYYFADLQHIPYNKNELMNEVELMSKDLGRVLPQTLMFRDFQSRNIMIHNGEVYFIDYQGCMQGPPQYDIASLLWQAKAELPDIWKEQLFNHYITCLKELKLARIEELHFRKNYIQFVLLRLIQVLGAYGFRGLLERKPHFLTSIAPALKNLQQVLSEHPNSLHYPELRKLLQHISTGEMQAKYAPKKLEANKGLQIEICSFSYKKQGIPATKGGHGGGFVFDCRGVLNPGRYEEYKYISGLDTAVKSFLETETRMPDFLENVYNLVSISVDDYLVRGFDSLSIAFGCTGGQHRSVYAAEKMAKYLQDTYGVSVALKHLNLENWLKQK